MQIGVQKNGGGFQDRWVSCLRTRGVSVKALDLLGADPLEQVADCDGVMWHWEHYPHERRFAARPILHVIETELRIPVFPNLRTAWHFDDKIAQAYLFSALRIPSARTWIFWDRLQAENWASTAVYPVVAKLMTGAGSDNVRLIRDTREANDHIRAVFSGSGLITPSLDLGRRTFRGTLKAAWDRVAGSAGLMVAGKYPSLPRLNWLPHKNYALFQEFLEGNSFDTRITVIGDRAFGFRRMNRVGDFRASGSGQLDHDPKAIDLRCVDLAFKSCALLGAQSVAFDFLFAGPDRSPRVVEISYGYADWAVERCPGHWDSRMTWREGHLWPEEAHVQDFLSEIEAAKARK